MRHLKKTLLLSVLAGLLTYQEAEIKPSNENMSFVKLKPEIVKAEKTEDGIRFISNDGIVKTDKF